MSDHDALDERLRAVERALTETDTDLTDLRDAAELTRELDALAARLEAVEERVDDLDAATQALRGYVGNVRAVNRSVEQTADAALSKVETLESESRQSKDGGFASREHSTGSDGSATPSVSAGPADGSANDTASASARTWECPTCGCGGRRPVETDPPDDGATDRGRFGRVGAALAGVLTGGRTESR